MMLVMQVIGMNLIDDESSEECIVIIKLGIPVYTLNIHIL